MRSQRTPSADWGTDAYRLRFVGWVEFLRDPTAASRSKRWVSRQLDPPYETVDWVQTCCELGDQAGFEPAVSFRCSIKSRVPSANSASLVQAVGGPGWLRSTCRRVKSALPLHSGLRLQVQSRCRLRRPLRSEQGRHRVVPFSVNWSFLQVPPLALSLIGQVLCC
jgi:hypothetical protein